MAVDRLLRIGMVSAVIAISLAVLISVLSPPRPQEPVDPLRDLEFFAQRETYARGEEVVLILRNHGDLTFTVGGWIVQRFLGGEWVVVECHASVAVIVGLEPSGELIIRWTAETAEPALCGTLPPVEAGLYRGGVGLVLSSEKTEHGLFAEFIVT